MKDDSQFFDEMLHNIELQPELRAYIAALMTKPVWVEPRQSIVLKWIDVESTHSFATYMQFGDSILWTSVWASEIFVDIELAYAIGMSSYARCHAMMREWKIFDKLSNELPSIVKKITRVVR